MSTIGIVRSAAIGALSCALCACSVNPLVQWKPAADPPKDLDAALADAQALRQKYEARVEQHIDRKLVTNDVLFGLGVVSFAAVVSKAHRDVLTTAAGLGGATYLYSTTGIQQPVLDAYQIGIGRVNCAATIGRAMRTDPKAIESQASQAKALRDELPLLAARISDAEFKLLGTANVDDAYKTAALARITEARAVLDSGSKVSKDADALLERDASAASKLLGTLNAIYQAVNEMASKGVAEPKAVLDSLKSLAGLVGDFGKAVGATTPAGPGAAASAPGTGPGNQGKSGDRGANPKSPPVPAADTSAVTAALEKMASSQEKVTVQADALAQRASRLSSTVDSDEFDKCVPDATKFGSLRVSASALNFVASPDDDQSQSFTVSGGVTNYTARFTSQPTFGISITKPPAGGGVFEVKVPKTVKGPHQLTLVVEDSSAARNAVSIPVKVAPADAKDKEAGNGADNQSQSGESRSLTSALAAAKKAGAAVPFGTGNVPSRLKIKSWATDASGVQLALTCVPGDKAEQLPNSQARTKWLTLLTDGFSLSPSDADAARKSASKFVVISDGGCLK